MSAENGPTDFAVTAVQEIIWEWACTQCYNKNFMKDHGGHLDKLHINQDTDQSDINGISPDR